MKPNAEARRTEWHWGPLMFSGLLGLHGEYLCFHRYLDTTSTDAIVDPGKPILPINAENSAAEAE